MDKSSKEKSSKRNQPAGSNKGVSQAGSTGRRAVKKKGKATAGSSNVTVQRTEEPVKQTGQTGLTQVNKDMENRFEDYSSNIAQQTEVHKNGITQSGPTESSKISSITENGSEIQQPFSIMAGSNIYSLTKDSIWQEPPSTLLPTEIEQKPRYPDELYESSTADWDELAREIYERCCVRSSENEE